MLPSLLQRFSGLFAEQALTSLGNFLFMLVGARLLGADSFGEVAILWAIVQLPSNFTFALVLLPISATDKEAPVRGVLAHASFMLLLTLAVFLVFHRYLVDLMGGGVVLANDNTSRIVLLWACAQLFHEMARWFVIRFCDYRFLVGATALRWGGFFILVFLQAGSLSPWGYIELNLYMLVAWNVAICLAEWKSFPVFRVLPRFSMPRFRSSTAYLMNGISNSAINFLAVYFLSNNFGSGAVGALQAFRSMANAIGIMAQFIDNHVTAALAKEKNISYLSKAHVDGMFLVIAGLSALLGLISEPLTVAALGTGYAPYSFALPFVVFGLLCQVTNRITIAPMRLADDHKIVYLSAVVAFVSIIPLMWLSSHLTDANILIAVSSMAPASLFVVNRLYLWRLGKGDAVGKA